MLVVTTVWVASFVASVLQPGREWPWVNAAMMLILGALFGLQIIRRNGGA